MKKLLLLFFSFSSLVLSAQTFCLQMTEITKTANELTVAIQMQGSADFELGSSNLQFTYNSNALSDPTFVSSPLAPPFYQIPTVTQVSGQGSNAASFNIELGFPGFGTTIPATPGSFFVGQLKFTITDPAQTSGILWTYNGGTTGTVVFLDDESTQIFATSTNPQCLNGLDVSLQSPLPLDLMALNAVARQNDISVLWNSANESNFSNFELQRSTDGKQFETIGNIEGMGDFVNNYKYLDQNVKPNQNYYYRLKMVDLDAKFNYSKIVSAKIAKSFGELRIFPNPVEANGLLNVENLYDERIRLKLYRPNGKLLKDLFLSGGESTEVNLNGIATGVINYSLETSTLLKSGSIIVQ